MPYSIDELKNKPSYQNIVDADRNEMKKYFEDEELKAQQSGSTIQAVRTLRDADGFILSYEDPDNLGNTMNSLIQKVRLPMEYSQADFTQVQSKLKKERSFSSFRPKFNWPPEPPPQDEEPTTDEQEQKKLEDEAAKVDKERAKEKKIVELAKKTNTTTETIKDNITNRKPPGRQDEEDRYNTQSDRDFMR